MPDMPAPASLAISHCPCCGTPAVQLPSPAYMRCALCQHRWRMPLQQATARHYETLIARNDQQSPWFLRKIADRCTGLSSMMGNGIQRILEIGCAEGELGRQIKQRFAVKYDGIELSLDRDSARTWLDTVYSIPAAQIDAPAYDLIVSFHVLEHIVDLNSEVLAWRRLLASDAQILIEVPNQAGHPLLDTDLNPEHVHQFTAASLMLLLSRAGFDCPQLSLGHYESPVYSDSIRLVATLRRDSGQRRNQLLQRFGERMGGPFAVYGIGGDFQNYVRPLADALQIQALLDTAPDKWGEQLAGHTVTGYTPELHDQLPILVCSIRYATVIRQHLHTMGIAAERIVSLEQIYGDA